MNYKKLMDRTLIIILLSASMLTAGAAMQQDRSAAASRPAISSLTPAKGGITIKWTDSKGATSYRVFRRISGRKSWNRIASVKSKTYTCKGMTSGTKYDFSVAPVSSSGKIGERSYSRTKKYIAAPVINKVVNTASGVSVTWARIKGASKYRIYRKREGGTWSEYKTLAGTNYIDTNVTSGSKYTYEIQAANTGGNPVSARSTAKALTYVSSPTINVANSPSGVEITWKAVKGAAKYKIWRLQDDGTWKRIGILAGTKFVNTSVESGVTYSYKVACFNENGSRISAISDIVDILYVRAPKLKVIVSETNSAHIDLSWEPVDDINKYRVYRKSETGKFTAICDTTETEYIDTGISNGMTYTYAVSCLSDDDTELSSRSKELSGMYYRVQTVYTINYTTYLKAEMNSSSETTSIRYMTKLTDLGIVKLTQGVWHEVLYNDNKYYLWEPYTDPRLTPIKSTFSYSSDKTYQNLILSYALSFLDKPTKYVTSAYGTLDEDGKYQFDCSNFVAYCINNVLNDPNDPVPLIPGYWFTKICNDEYEQRKTLKLAEVDSVLITPIEVIEQGETLDISKLEPGDLIYWNLKKENKKNGEPRVVDHVGMYLGNNEFIHCSSTFNVNISSIRGVYLTEFVGAIRVIPDSE